MKVEILEVAGLVPAMQALRLPYGRYPRSQHDKEQDDMIEYGEEYVIVNHSASVEYIHKDDLTLAQKLIKAGDEHAKVLRGCIAYMKITAPRYFWQEFSTYRVGCECLSSTSTMHTITKGVEPEMFDADYSDANALADCIQIMVDYYNEQTDPNKKEKAFLDIKRQLPECFLQTRIFAISYQTLRRIWKQRRNHRLPEWRVFINACAELPFANELIFVE